MNYKKILEKLGLVEGIDFSITSDYFEMLEKTKQVVSNTIHHEEIPAVFENVHHEEIPRTFNTIHHEEVPAVFDEEGNEVSSGISPWDEEIELTPMIPAWDESVLVQQAIGAYDEYEYEDEQYTPDAPSEELLEQTWKQVQIDSSDLVLLIAEYVSDKNKFEEDSYNIVDNKIFRWTFKEILEPTEDELIALIPTVKADQEIKTFIEDNANEGEKLELDCKKCLQFITGYNDGRLTGTQLQTMLTSFNTINQCLINRMPKSAKSLLTVAAVDGTIVTQKLKDTLLYILKDYPLV